MTLAIKLGFPKKPTLFMASRMKKLGDDVKRMAERICQNHLNFHAKTAPIRIFRKLKTVSPLFFNGLIKPILALW